MTSIIGTDWYQLTALVVGCIAGVCAVFSIVGYVVTRAESGRADEDTKVLARLSLLGIFLGPVATVAWPLILPVLVVIGIGFLIRDAIGVKK